MAWNGTGTFVRTNGVGSGPTTWGQAESADRDIRADDHDTHDEDLADGIQACLTKNGENSPTANLPMNGNRHTGVSNAVDDDEYAAWGQVKSYVAPKMVTLTEAATINWDGDAAPMARVTLTGDRTLAISNTTEGGTYALWCRMDSSGSHTLTLPGTSDLDLGALPGTIDMDAGQITLLSFIQSFGKLRLAGQRPDYGPD